jgi:hypothetical protein
MNESSKEFTCKAKHMRRMEDVPRSLIQTFCEISLSNSSGSLLLTLSIENICTTNNNFS